MPEIGRWDPVRDGPLTETALRQKLEAMAYTVHRYVYSPGTFFPDHTHSSDKIDAVLSGRFRVVLQDLVVILGPGEWVAVPAGVVHCAEVLGNEPVVSLDGVRRGSQAS
jgi:quercetin dioxygenase-like cupin family protein